MLSAFDSGVEMGGEECAGFFQSTDETRWQLASESPGKAQELSSGAKARFSASLRGAEAPTS
jgi:hypothetical protein